ncbi:hypothetical protein WJX72_003489 [[Myrmecia] bisecta]|uniref:Ankyrin repeat protein n=1 Tax=[Myrmecia] bisecta TaxID=41462 RepID=A0AAW1R625_9CHLO
MAVVHGHVAAVLPWKPGDLEMPPDVLRKSDKSQTWLQVLKRFHCDASFHEYCRTERGMPAEHHEHLSTLLSLGAIWDYKCRSAMLWRQIEGKSSWPDSLVDPDWSRPDEDMAKAAIHTLWRPTVMTSQDPKRIADVVAACKPYVFQRGKAVTCDIEEEAWLLTKKAGSQRHAPQARCPHGSISHRCPADAVITTKTGWNAAHMVACCVSPSVTSLQLTRLMRAVIDGGVDFTAKDAEGRTPLCYAAFHAEEGQPNLTVLQMAAASGHAELVKVLLKHPAPFRCMRVALGPVLTELMDAGMELSDLRDPHGMDLLSASVFWGNLGAESGRIAMKELQLFIGSNGALHLQDGKANCVR